MSVTVGLADDATMCNEVNPMVPLLRAARREVMTRLQLKGAGTRLGTRVSARVLPVVMRDMELVAEFQLEGTSMCLGALLC